jgi:MarR family transcriptional regulator, organic hydroperoxide resistance regulator
MRADTGEESLRLSDQLCFSIYATAHAFNRLYKPILEPLGLTYPQYLVMLVLWEQDGLTVKDIGHRLYLDSGTLTPVLKRLEAMGYVQRKRDLSDERQVRVALTPYGGELRSRALAGRRQLMCAAGLSEEEIQALKRELDQLRMALGADSQQEGRPEVPATGDVRPDVAGASGRKGVPKP